MKEFIIEITVVSAQDGGGIPNLSQPLLWSWDVQTQEMVVTATGDLPHRCPLVSGAQHYLSLQLQPNTTSPFTGHPSECCPTLHPILSGGTSHMARNRCGDQVTENEL